MLCSPCYFSEYVVAEFLSAVSIPLDKLIKSQLSTRVDEPKSGYLPRKGGSENLCFPENDLGGAYVPATAKSGFSLNIPTHGDCLR